MIRITTILLCVALLSMAGCKDKKGTKATGNEPTASGQHGQPGPGAQNKPQVAATEEDLDKLDIKTAAEPETEVAEDEIPTPADYEEEAAEKISAINLELELEAIEHELVD